MRLGKSGLRRGRIFKRLTSDQEWWPLSHLAGLGLFALYGLWAFAARPEPLLLHSAATALFVIIAVWDWGSYQGGWTERLTRRAAGRADHSRRRQPVRPACNRRRSGASTAPESPVIELDEEQQSAREWFEALRDRICAEFEGIEREAGSDARFEYTPWERSDPDGAPGGGGVRGLMKGAVFEKVGVNVSTVAGRFTEEFAATIHGAADDPRFFATGISLVAHMANPHVPAVHMNTRFLATTKRWFGGGADLNPPIPYEEDIADFHARFRAACAAHDQTFYERFKKWADDYFWIPHRGLPRGAGGIFYDHLEGPFELRFAFTRDVGEALLDVFPRLVRRRMNTPYDEADKARQLEWRGRYAEFNLLYDRGTLFGLRTGGNVDAILMSLPPAATWG